MDFVIRLLLFIILEIWAIEGMKILGGMIYDLQARK